MKISAINRRISVVILVFVASSLGASLLPLVPGIRETIPLSFLERRQALGVYGGFLLGFMAMLFPAMVRLPDDRSSVMPWAWVGGFALAFAGVPTFVLAYIAGVHVHGVVEILMWAGAFHGLALVSLQVLGYRWRIVPIVIGFLLAVVVPVVAEARSILDLGDGAFSPFRSVGALARGMREPDLALPAAVTAALYGVVVITSRRARKLKAAVIVAGFAVVLLVSAAPAPADVEVTSLIGEWRVAGQPLPLRLTAARAGVHIEVAVADRETWSWTPRSGGPLVAWAHVDVIDPADSVVVTADGHPVAKLRGRPADRPLVLLVGIDAGVLGARTDIRGVQVAVDALPDSRLGFAPFAAVVTTERLHERLGAGAKEAVRQWVLSGGALHLLEAKSDAVRRVGAGSVSASRAAALAPRFHVVPVGRPALAANLYSNFAVPDWGRVELTPVIIFLGVYHVVFYLIFLLPLLLDARKSLGVYLTSVGFVLVVVIVGAYFVLTRVFLEESQLLQQNVQVVVIDSPSDGEVGLRHEQLACFASFNDQPVRIEFESANAPRLVHGDAGRGAGRVVIASDGKKLTMPSVPVDRNARKQVVSLSRATASPIRIERTGSRSIRLRAVPGAADEAGLWTARRLTAFVREGGRLHAARIAGAELTWSEAPARTGWGEVLAGVPLEPDVVPFLRYLLGRKVGRHVTVAVVLVEGMRPLEIENDALHVRDIVQVLMIPLPPAR